MHDDRAVEGDGQGQIFIPKDVRRAAKLSSRGHSSGALRETTQALISTEPKPSLTASY